MLTRLGELPLLVLLIGLCALAMAVPAIHATSLGLRELAWEFTFSAIVVALAFVILAMATLRLTLHRSPLGHLAGLVAVYLCLPFVLAVPLLDAVPELGYLNAYFEMSSALTTTGASLLDPWLIPDPVHLWRAIVGWIGGFLVWVTAVAVLAPLNLGGFEVRSAGRSDMAGRMAQPSQITRIADTSERVRRFAGRLLPIYAGLTGVLWLLLIFAGDTPFVAICHAMATLSTSGITPGGGPANAPSGFLGEAMIFLFLIFALSRSTFSRDVPGVDSARALDDPELRMGLLCVLILPLALFLRHWLGALDSEADSGWVTAIAALWGSMFTVLSFLTTTGFESAGWDDSRLWSGLQTPGLILMGLALIGGGVATTAGGVKLLRVYALYLHGAREMQRLVVPDSVAGAGQSVRRMRRQGAYVAWIFFMLFAISVTVVMVAFSTTGLAFEPAMILTVAGLSTTGPLAGAAGAVPIDYADLAPAAKAIFCAAAILGRLETLALIALFNPEFWRN